MAKEKIDWNSFDIDDDVIIKIYFENKTGTMCSARLRENWLVQYPNVRNYLDNRFEDSQSYRETVYRIFNKIEKRPVCPICGNVISFKRHFPKTCSTRCAALYCIEDKKKTCQERYNCDYFFQSQNFKDKCTTEFGVDNPAKSPDILRKIDKTCEERYNAVRYSASDEGKKKISETFKNKSPEEKDRLIKNYKSTNLAHFGVDSPMKVEEIKNKSVQNAKTSNLSKFGETNIFNVQKHKQDILNAIIAKYGPDYKDKFDEIDYVANKEKYGLEWKFTVLRSIEKAYSPEGQKKRYETYKKNISYNSSNLEKLFERYLIEKYGETDIETQYRSELYEYSCDFYIKSLDLYIELQGMWTHGSKPFEGSDEDQAKVKKWKSKNTQYYDNAIRNWTVTDVKKRAVAKEHGLNYLEIFPVNNCIGSVIQTFEGYVSTQLKQK